MTDIRWVTYAELAEALKIGPDSARNLVRRKRWQRQTGNDGLARIGVPVEHFSERTKADGEIDAPINPSIEPPIDAPVDGGMVVPVLTRHIERLEAQIEGLTFKLQSVEAERDEARDALTQASLIAATVEPLKATINALKQALDADKARMSELREERDRWHRQATASRGLLAWFKRSA